MTTFIEFYGQRKTVVDYVGAQAGMPEAVSELEAEIDRVAGTSKWITGNVETGPALLAESGTFDPTPRRIVLYSQTSWRVDRTI